MDGEEFFAETVQQPVQLAQASDSDDEDDLPQSSLQKKRDATRRWNKTEAETVIPDDVRLQNVGVHLPMLHGKGRCEVYSVNKVESTPHSKCRNYTNINVFLNSAQK